MLPQSFCFHLCPAKVRANLIFISLSPRPEWKLHKGKGLCSLQNSQCLGLGLSGAWDSRESAYNAGDPGSIPGSGRSPGEENGNPLQYSCLENSMDRGAWQATVHGVIKSWTKLSKTNTFTFFHDCAYTEQGSVNTCQVATRLFLPLEYQPLRARTVSVMFTHSPSAQHIAGAQ